MKITKQLITSKLNLRLKFNELNNNYISKEGKTSYYSGVEEEEEYKNITKDFPIGKLNLTISLWW